jgi:hypothetical protein
VSCFCLIFFWRPGTQSQQNVKGMLCSLIYQIFLALPGAVEYVISIVSDTTKKDSEADWSFDELYMVCIGLIQTSLHPIFLVLDGSDEADPQDGFVPNSGLRKLRIDQLRQKCNNELGITTARLMALHLGERDIFDAHSARKKSNSIGLFQSNGRNLLKNGRSEQLKNFEKATTKGLRILSHAKEDSIRCHKR